MALIKDKEKRWSEADRQTKLPCFYSNCLRDSDCVCMERQISQPGTAQYQLIWGTLGEKLLLSASAHYYRSSSLTRQMRFWS